MRAAEVHNMTKEEIDSKVRAQFRLDTNCSPEDEAEKIININEASLKNGARYYDDISPYFRAIVYHGEMYMCADMEILDWCREKYSLYKPEWFCKYRNLRELDGKLQENGYRIKDTHIYCLPDTDFEGYVFDTPYEVRWYGREEILKFKDENPFKNALAYIPGCPDVIAVAALDAKGDPVAMAGASEDSETMWQIGIDVMPVYEHKGIAVYLVTMLKEKILEMGRIPFYGTSESHSNSLNVGIKSGFLPAFTEIFCCRL